MTEGSREGGERCKWGCEGTVERPEERSNVSVALWGWGRGVGARERRVTTHVREGLDGETDEERAGVRQMRVRVT